MKLLRERNKNIVFNNNEYQIYDCVYYRDVYSAREIPSKCVKYVENPNNLQQGIFVFNIDYYNNLYSVIIKIDKKCRIVGTRCNCSEFQKKQSCIHVGACFLNYCDIIFLPPNNLITPKSLISKINKYNKVANFNIKKEAKLEIEFECVGYYYNDADIPMHYYKVKCKTGVDKLYLLKKMFFSNYYNNKEYEFGKGFTYKPYEHFFNSHNKKILDYLNIVDALSKNSVSGTIVSQLIRLLEDKPFMFNGVTINKIIEGFPLKSYIKEENDKYVIDFGDVDFIPVDTSIDYVFCNKEMYHLNEKDKILLQELVKSSSNKIEIDNNKFANFTSALLPILKKNISVDEKIKDKVIIVSKPECELYFDIKAKDIVAKIELIYDKKINYFDSTKDIIRDLDYENEILNALVQYGFFIENKKILLIDLEKIVYFIDYGLKEISTKYPVFTTEKFKKTNVKHTTSITSHFGIGQNNIMSYNFDLEGINSEELVNIFKDIKAKKRYYRLKNGDILNLEDNDLQELNNLAQEMEMTDEDIIAGNGEILKYRAIYLDSVKDSKYSIIKTDNLFNKFVDNFYKYKDCDINLSKNELNILRDYQVVGVKWLYNLSKTGFGGILADEMGLGKTIQVIYYIKQKLLDDKNSKFLIVVPTSLIYNWEKEFDLFAPEIDKSLIVGNKTKRDYVLKNSSSVTITTYGLLREDAIYYEDIKYDTCIIDEAQNIKNYNTGISKTVKSIKAQTYFALTGTPIENSAVELWSIFDFVMPGYLSTIQKFQSKYKIHDFGEQSELLIKGLSNQISPFILRRKKKDVVKELPDKFENNIYIDLSSEQKKLYAAELERVQKEMEEIMTNGGMSKARFLILQLLTKLRQICIDPKIIYENYDGDSNKIDAFVNVIKESIANGHKIIVFTSFRSALNIVKEALENENIKTTFIDGSISSKERMNRVDMFNNGMTDINVFLIMLKSGGTGLNLASADVVIHLDLWWNPQAENQATDRAHRIGQTHVVEVIRLISKGTIEEKILELQEKKRKLSDKLIDGKLRDENLLSQLTKEDIENLLSYENKD